MKVLRGYVYFALAEGTFTKDQKVRIKIGRTCSSVDKRHHQIEQHDRKNRGTTGPCEIIGLNEVLISDCVKAEKKLHSIFNPYKYRIYENDEWFELSLLQVVVLSRVRSEHLEELILLNNPTYADLCDLVYRKEEVSEEPDVIDEGIPESQQLYRVIGKEGIEISANIMEGSIK